MKIGLSQTLRDVAVKVTELLGQLTALSQIQASFEAFIDDANAFGDGIALQRNVLIGHGGTGLADAVEKSIEQHDHQLMGAGPIDPGLDVNLTVHGGDIAIAVHARRGAGGGGVHLDFSSGWC